MEDRYKCDLCEEPYKTLDGKLGNPNEDCLMVNDYITMTNWYKNNKSEKFKITHPNPYACRKCVKKIVDGGLGKALSGDPERFLTEQEWWKR